LVCASTLDNNVAPSVESVSGRNFNGLCYPSERNRSQQYKGGLRFRLDGTVASV